MSNFKVGDKVACDRSTTTEIGTIVQVKDSSEWYYPIKVRFGETYCDFSENEADNFLKVLQPTCVIEKTYTRAELKAMTFAELFELLKD